jgi:hypothetical protein
MVVNNIARLATPNTTCMRFKLRQVDSVAGMLEDQESGVSLKSAIASPVHPFSRRPKGPRLRFSAKTIGQKFKKYSGIAMMYFKFTVHRSTILIGSVIINSSKFDISM